MQPSRTILGPGPEWHHHHSRIFQLVLCTLCPHQTDWLICNVITIQRARIGARFSSRLIVVALLYRTRNMKRETLVLLILPHPQRSPVLDSTHLSDDEGASKGCKCYDIRENSDTWGTSHDIHWQAAIHSHALLSPTSSSFSSPLSHQCFLGSLLEPIPKEA